MKKMVRAGGGRTGVSPAVNALRPAVEAVMLAAVAFGCAHAGWSILAPPAQGSIDASGAAADDWRASVEVQPERFASVSPFAPDAADPGALSSAASALVSSLKLVSIRVSDDEARSGAIIALQDGEERAFLVGQTLSDGVTLASVTGNGVVLEFAGGRRELSIEPQARHSFAAALLGRIDPPQEMAFVANTGTPEDSALSALSVGEGNVETPFLTASTTTRTPIVAVTQNDIAASPAAPADLASYVSSLVSSLPDGRIPDGGLRLVGPLPGAIVDLGLQEGDALIAVNGAAAIDAAALVQHSRSGAIELTVQRAAAAPFVVRAQLRSAT